MAPTPDEELKLRLFSGNTSQLGPAERFLKVLVEIPFAFKRMEALLFMSSLQEEVSGIKESFAALEVRELILELDVSFNSTHHFLLSPPVNIVLHVANYLSNALWV